MTQPYRILPLVNDHQAQPRLLRQTSIYVRSTISAAQPCSCVEHPIELYAIWRTVCGRCLDKSHRVNQDSSFLSQPHDPLHSIDNPAQSGARIRESNSVEQTDPITMPQYSHSLNLVLLVAHATLSAVSYILSSKVFNGLCHLETILFHYAITWDLDTLSLDASRRSRRGERCSSNTFGESEPMRFSHEWPVAFANTLDIQVQWKRPQILHRR